MSEPDVPEEEEGEDNKWPYSNEKKKVFDTYFGLLEGNASDTTIPTRKSNLKTFFGWLEANDVAIDDFESHHMTQFVSTLQNNEMADASIGACVSAVGKFYVYLVQEEQSDDIDVEVEANPLEQWSLKEHEFLDINPNMAKQTRILRDRGDADEAIVALPKEKVEEIIAHPKSPALRNELIIRLTWETGVRMVELCEIRKRDINREKQEIHIRSAKAEPKDDNYIRRVYYSDETDWLLTKWLDYGEREVMNPSAPEWDDDETTETKYLLLTDQSPQLRPSFASRKIKEAAQEAGLNEPLYTDAAGKKRWLVTGHTLRHSHISHHANNLETPLHMVAKLAGHRKLDTTRQYVSTDWEIIAKRAQKFF